MASDRPDALMKPQNIEPFIKAGLEAASGALVLADSYVRGARPEDRSEDRVEEMYSKLATGLAAIGVLERQLLGQSVQVETYKKLPDKESQSDIPRARVGPDERRDLAAEIWGNLIFTEGPFKRLSNLSKDGPIDEIEAKLGQLRKDFTDAIDNAEELAAAHGIVLPQQIVSQTQSQTPVAER